MLKKRFQASVRLLNVMWKRQWMQLTFSLRGPQTDVCEWNLLRLDVHRLFDAYLLTIDPVECQVMFLQLDE
jgi:hypothetical protein